ncbi:uncharacterized protein EV420DRAFT_1510828 [Desarmillaria tabescens]|uniref:WW domain-containing protein n=1 Tax=Armillaria tabescens TaxID=1929756 RepID=A0AA39T5P7_ARMTA|nr:uncharacterized protein EV420DRAFT_1510828 [Desarmillaria tabescens]KAK0466271.1 hypothetical protein EV420DRAFT_1510828 [Desarmillaria tabescens]
MTNSQGKPYFYDANTQQSPWDPPAGLAQEQMQLLGYFPTMSVTKSEPVICW